MENSEDAPTTTCCFLCLSECESVCPHCHLVRFCCPEHLRLHRRPPPEDGCFPYEVRRRPEVGRVLVAVRPIRPAELIMIDQGAVVGPYRYGAKSRPVCLECLDPVGGAYGGRAAGLSGRGHKEDVGRVNEAIGPIGTSGVNEVTEAIELNGTGTGVRGDSQVKGVKKTTVNGTDVNAANNLNGSSDTGVDSLGEEAGSSSSQGFVLCPGCSYPMCSAECCSGPTHQRECGTLGRGRRRGDMNPWEKRTSKQRKREKNELKSPNGEEEEKDDNRAYNIIAPLRMLLLQEQDSDAWQRTQQLMDHRALRQARDPSEWLWEQKHIADHLRLNVDLGGRVFSEEQIHRAIGLLKINAVALKYSSSSEGQAESNKGLGLYPIFAIMSHSCWSNAFYSVQTDNVDKDANKHELRVRARREIGRGEEITVQYVGGLVGTDKRRRRLRDQWHFDCSCLRCSDSTEFGTFLSAVKCFGCSVGDAMPKDPLDYRSGWECPQCGHSVIGRKVARMVSAIEEELDGIETERDGIEQELNGIGRSARANLMRYMNFVEKYQNTLLHPNHYLLMKARQIMLTKHLSGVPKDRETLCRKLHLCQTLDGVIRRADRGSYSEFGCFVTKEMHLCRLLLSQRDLAEGYVGREEYLLTSGESLAALDQVQRDRRSMEL